MRNKYKNLLNRNQSPKNNTSILLSEKKNNNSNYYMNNANKNSFINKNENKGRDKNINHENNDKKNEQKRIKFNRHYIPDKKDEIKHNEINKSKNEEKNTSKYKSVESNILFKKINDSNNNNNIKSKENKNNINNISTSKNNQNISRRFTVRKRNENQDDKNKNKLEIIEFKYSNNEDKDTDRDRDKNINSNSIFNFRKNKYSSSFINNSKANLDNLDNKNKSKKQEIKSQKFIKDYDDLKNDSNKNNISFLNITQQINNLNNNYMNNFNKSNKININTTSNERSNEIQKKTYNFRKLRAKETSQSNKNDEKEEEKEKVKNIIKSPEPPSCLLSPIINSSNRKKFKFNYRSKRALNADNAAEQNEKEELNNNDNHNNNKENNNNENNNNRNDSKDKDHLSKTTKNEKYLENKTIDNETKTDDTNLNKRMMRRFLYFRSSKNIYEKKDREEKTPSPKNTPISTELKPDINSPDAFALKMNRINEINKSEEQKQSFRAFFRNNIKSENATPIIENKITQIQENILDNNVNNNSSNNIENMSVSQDINTTFGCFPNELDLNLGQKNQLFKYNYDYNISNFKTKRNKSTKSNISVNSIKSNRSSNSMNIHRFYSPSSAIYRKSIVRPGSYYKKIEGNYSPQSFYSPKRSTNYDKISIKSLKRLNSPYSENNISSISNSNISNNIINNNTYNTTLNIFKMTSKDKKKMNNNFFITKLQKDKRFEPQEQYDISQKYKKHLRTNSDYTKDKSYLYFSMINGNNSNSFSNFSNIIPNSYSSCKSLSNNIHDYSYYSEIYNNNYEYKIDLQILYILEAKLQNILNKINKYTVCHIECFDLITYYFSSKFYEKEIRLFQSKHSINNISYYIKFELLCYFLCYDVCFNKSFNQTGILLKTIISLLHTNFLILIAYILNDDSLYKTNNENIKMWIYKLTTIVDNNLKIKLVPQDFSEAGILNLLGNNLKEVNNYYKMIIDNLYSHFYTKKNIKKNYNDSKYKFPNCLQLDLNELDYYEKLNVISLFFFDAYRLLNNYNFEDLKYFFDSFLQRIKYQDQINSSSSKIQIRPLSKSKSKNVNNMKNIVIYKYNYANGNFYYLPPMKKCYKYTLVLDLDETLIYLMPNNIYLNSDGKIGEAKHTLIFRPGLINFLQRMKPLYEMVIFSFGTYQYVDSVIRIIERKETYFEHILYRQHATINSGEYIKDLSLLGRDLKNIIIVDDIPQVFKLQERNGICIKPFYGDAVTDRNTLKILGKILETVRFDAEETGDIRKSLDKHRNVIFNHITNNIE